MPNAATHGHRQRADVALALLITLGVTAILIALAFSQHSPLAVLAVVTTLCRRSIDETLAHSADLGRLSLLLPFGVGLLLAAVEGIRLARATRRWIPALGDLRCAPSGRMRRLIQKCGLDGRAVVFDADHPIVFTHGVLAPKVWLSTGLLRALDNREMEAVLLHEVHHVNARDPLKVLVVRCLSRALFFVPVARDLSDAYSTSKEVAADHHAARTMGDAVPLVRALRKLLSGDPVQGLEVGLAGEPGVIEARLQALLDPSQKAPLFPLPRLGLSALWLVALLVIFFLPTAGHVPSFAECGPRSAIAIGSFRF